MTILSTRRRRTEPAPVPQPPPAERPRAVDPAPLACPPGTTRAVLNGLRTQGKPTIRMARPERVRIVPMRIKLPAAYDAVVLHAPTLAERCERVGLLYAKRGTGAAR